jgi:hypothetical protein
MAKRVLMTLESKNEPSFYSSTHSYATTYYVLKKVYPEQDLRKSLIKLSGLVEIIGVNHLALLNALKDISFNDFEDGLQFHTAKRIPQNIDIIISRNKKDFKSSSIRVLAPDEFLLEFG